MFATSNSALFSALIRGNFLLRFITDIYYHYIIELLQSYEFEITRIIIRSCNYTRELQNGNGNLTRYSNVMHLI